VLQNYIFFIISPNLFEVKYNYQKRAHVLPVLDLVKKPMKACFHKTLDKYKRKALKKPFMLNHFLYDSSLSQPPQRGRGTSSR
jgi:hypothetical protein